MIAVCLAWKHFQSIYNELQISNKIKDNKYFFFFIDFALLKNEKIEKRKCQEKCIKQTKNIL